QGRQDRFLPRAFAWRHRYVPRQDDCWPEVVGVEILHNDVETFEFVLGSHAAHARVPDDLKGWLRLAAHPWSTRRDMAAADRHVGEGVHHPGDEVVRVRERLPAVDLGEVRCGEHNDLRFVEWCAD